MPCSRPIQFGKGEETQCRLQPAGKGVRAGIPSGAIREAKSVLDSPVGSSVKVGYIFGIGIVEQSIHSLSGTPQTKKTP